MDGRQHVASIPSFRDADDSTDDTDDCPWCAALLEAPLPPTAPPSTARRRYDPYVSGAPYDGDDW